MNPLLADEGEASPEHFLASFYGIFALALGATVWSGLAAIFGPWSLPAAPGLGWMIAWACRHGGRCTDSFVRVAGWLLGIVGVLFALFVFTTFSVTQSSPDSGLQLRAVGIEYLRLFAEPPWFGSVAVLLTLAGARCALRDPGPRRRATRPARKQTRENARVGADRPITAAAEPGSRAA